MPEKEMTPLVQMRIVLDSGADWYALAVSDDVESADVMDGPKFVLGEKTGYTTWIDPTKGGESGLADFPAAFVWRMNKPTNDPTNVRIELTLRLKVRPGAKAIRFRVGKGWLDKAVTHFYDARGKHVFARVTPGGREGGDWNDREFSFPVKSLLP